MRYDVVIAGAGTAGCTASLFAAKSGLDVCLIDKKPLSHIGDKVCGDAVSEDFFDFLAIDKPKGDELAKRIRGIEVYSPDLRSSYRIEHPTIKGLSLNRHQFGQRLLNDSISAGTELLDRTRAKDLITRNKQVIGVETTNDEIYGDVILDCSGTSAVLRRKVSAEKIRRRDIARCYREIRVLDQELDRPDYFKIYLSQEISPGGYTWIAPKSDTSANVGLGLFSGDNAKHNLYKHVLSRPEFKNSKLLDGRYGIVPTRRPLDSMVASGIMFAGDAACHVNPMHGGGIGQSMIAGKLAVEVASNAIEKGDTSSKALWGYNKLITKEFGAKHAKLDAFRREMQNLRDKEINYGMRYSLMTGNEILKAGLGEKVEISRMDILRRILIALPHFPMLLSFLKASLKHKRVSELYQDYPDPKDFLDWRSRLNEIWDTI